MFDKNTCLYRLCLAEVTSVKISVEANYAPQAIWD